MNKYPHPKSGNPIYGMRLAPGTVLRKTDMYDSSDGIWRACPCPGVILQDGCETIWVRPETEESIDKR